MTRHHAELLVPHSRQRIFELVAHVEHYPEFVPWWIAARVTGKHHLIYETEQIMGMGPVRIRFHSQTELHPPDRIIVSSHGGMVKDLDLTWQFEDAAPPPGLVGEACLVSLDMTLQLSSPRMQALLAGMEREAAPKLVRAFADRADHLYSGH
ncbi:MAG: type II toxin-antitoxin system RatA family toxin [Rhodospirillaceae bacterium]